MRTVTVRAVNVERLRMTVTPIPDSLLTAVLGPPGFRPASIVGDLERARVALGGHSRTCAIQYRDDAGGPVAGSMSTASEAPFPGSSVRRRHNDDRANSIRTTAAGESRLTANRHRANRAAPGCDGLYRRSPNLAMSRQVSRLVAHAKLGDAVGTPCSRHPYGRFHPMAQASVTLYDSAWGTMARARF